MLTRSPSQKSNGLAAQGSPGTATAARLIQSTPASVLSPFLRTSLGTGRERSHRERASARATKGLGESRDGWGTESGENPHWRSQDKRLSHPVKRASTIVSQFLVENYQLEKELGG